MISLNVIDGNIVGSYGEKSFSVTYTEKLYEQMQELAKKADRVETMDELKAILDTFDGLAVEDYTKLIEDKCEFIYVNQATGQFFLKTGDVVSLLCMRMACRRQMQRRVQPETGAQQQPFPKARAS